MSDNREKLFSQENNERRDSFTSLFHTDDTPLPEGLENLAELAELAPQIHRGKGVSPQFKPTIEHFSKKLAVLVSVTSGEAHPDAPQSILAFHLLTNQQLDDIARHYHQVWPPMPESFEYPKMIPAWIGTESEDTTDIATKRRRIGRFIGMRGCESPVESSFGLSVHATEDSGTLDADQDECPGLAQRLEREWQEAMLRARMEGSSDLILPPKGRF
ncbi:uncharacterized protein TRUGW13939_01218 [Talaromyces rugulosus]|uniref:Uncharacterized protein n=1 Tax=Talaromyces rugulosus TaxID=121627 RepID=A0A7H8QJM0_TALRU|nr:uncharacterized protein TRUGW13939_01218 [Talaromyces rugulosus]QKX54134.1 hypothetical protein TRUGW13939_01218 [Talaromyces rugulosus]